MTGPSTITGGSDPAAIPASGPPGAAFVGPARRAISGSLWSLGGYGASQVLRFGSNLVLARLLFPEAFGLVALVWVIVDGLNMVSDFGLGPFIIQDSRGDDPQFLNTVWTLQVGRGLVLWVCTVLLARPVAAFYGQPALSRFLPLAGLLTVIDGFRSTSVLTLSRRVALTKVVLLELLTQGVAIGVMLVTAWRYSAAWSLIVGALAGVVVRTCVSHWLIPGRRDRLQWDSEAARAVFHFGKWILLGTPLVFLSGQVDRLLLGRLVPLDVFGVYSIAARLAQLASGASVQVSTQALYPAVADRVRANPEALASEVHKARSVVLPVGVLCTLALMLLAPLFFGLLYDERYSAAAWMAQLLGASVWITILQGSADRVLLVVGDSRSLAVASGTRLVATVLACLVGFALAGLPGFLVGLAFGSLAGHVYVLLTLRRHGISAVRQDVMYSSVLLACCLIGLGGFRLWAGPAGEETWKLVAVAGIELVAVAGWSMLRIRSLAMGR